jgi:hypothetical protein
MAQTLDPNGTLDEKLPLSEQIADILLKAIRTGGVGLGGIGALWLLVKEDNDIPRAVASLLIGVGISYGASLLDPLHKGNKRRFAKMGEDVDRGVDRIAENAIAKVRGVEDQYFQCQAWDCRRYRSEGIAQHDRIFKPLLEEVFVPLQLDPGSLQPGFRAPDIQRLQLMRSDGQKIWDLLKQADKQPVFRQIVILAWGGYGKTTLLKHIAYTYGMNQQGKYGAPRRTPFLLMLRKYRDVIAKAQPPSLPELITQHHVPSLPESEQLNLPSDWAKNKLLHGEAVIMFDLMVLMRLQNLSVLPLPGGSTTRCGATANQLLSLHHDPKLIKSKAWAIAWNSQRNYGSKISTRSSGKILSRGGTCARNATPPEEKPRPTYKRLQTRQLRNC